MSAGALLDALNAAGDKAVMVRVSGETFTVVYADGSSREATASELLQLAQIEQTAKAIEDQQSAGIVEAKRAYARLQTIIDGADTATTVQLRSAIKEIARDVQHLIRAAVR